MIINGANTTLKSNSLYIVEVFYMNKEMWDAKDIGSMLYVNGKPFLARRKKLELMKANESVEDDPEVLSNWLQSEDPDTYDFNDEIERKVKEYYESHKKEVEEN